MNAHPMLLLYYVYAHPNPFLLPSAALLELGVGACPGGLEFPFSSFFDESYFFKGF